jgi:Holliday junction resolvase RusA-like endonuclease
MIYRFAAKVKDRPRLGRKGRVFTPKQTLDFERAVRDGWNERKIEGPVAMEIVVGKDWFSVRTWPFNGLRNGSRGDLDNYIKSIADGLVGVAYNDDKQVEFIEARFSCLTADEAEKQT